MTQETNKRDLYQAQLTKKNHFFDFFYFSNFYNNFKKMLENKIAFDNVFATMNSFDCLAFVPDEKIKLVRTTSDNLNKPISCYNRVILDI